MEFPAHAVEAKESAYSHRRGLHSDREFEANHVKCKLGTVSSLDAACGTHERAARDRRSSAAWQPCVLISLALAQPTRDAQIDSHTTTGALGRHAESEGTEAVGTNLSSSTRIFLFLSSTRRVRAGKKMRLSDPYPLNIECVAESERIKRFEKYYIRTVDVTRMASPRAINPLPTIPLYFEASSRGRL